MVGIKPPSLQRIWRLDSAYFYREVISQINNLWYNILEVVIKGSVVNCHLAYRRECDIFGIRKINRIVPS